MKLFTLYMSLRIYHVQYKAKMELLLKYSTNHAGSQIFKLNKLQYQTTIEDLHTCIDGL